jgi:hypothetical protein
MSQRIIVAAVQGCSPNGHDVNLKFRVLQETHKDEHRSVVPELQAGKNKKN